MEFIVQQVAARIKGLREMMEISTEEMASCVGVDENEYIQCENGESDFSFTFLYKCANRFGVDIAELVLGEAPRLSFYSITRDGEGIPIKRRAGFKYQHLAYMFKNKTAEPFKVSAPYLEEEQDAPIHLSSHKGQEMDYILSGSLKVNLDGHEEILYAGDTIYYDSSRPHGMIATGGEPCEFLAIVFKAQDEEKKKNQ